MDKNKDKHLSVFREIRNGIFDFKQKLTSHFNQDFIQEDLSNYDLIGTLTITEDLTDQQVIERLVNQNYLNTNVINNTPYQNSFLDTENTKVRYKYEGPQDSKNRDFCSFMLQRHKDSFFRREDINIMSFARANDDFKPYSIWDFKGSYNCRHNWVAYVFTEREGEKPIVRVSKNQSS